MMSCFLKTPNLRLAISTNGKELCVASLVVNDKLEIDTA